VLHAYYSIMFIRKNRNRSASVRVQIITKDHGRYRVLRTIGTSSDPDQIERFHLQAQSFLRTPNPDQGELFALHTTRDHVVENLVSSLGNAQVRTIGPELIYGTLYDRMGFNQIPEPLFRHMVIARLAYPGSKPKTVDSLHRYQSVTVSSSALYRAMDRFHDRYQAQTEHLVYAHTCKRVTVLAALFYDVTALYVEASDEDDLRKAGFSKDGEFHHPRIILGLLLGARSIGCRFPP